MSNESSGLVGAIRKDFPAFAIFLLAGVLLALGIRAALNPEETSTPHDHEAMRLEPPPVAPAPAATGPLIDLGNEICPIMKKPVNGRTYSVWDGLRVGHCCPPCIKDLLADPARLLDEAGIEWRPAAEAMRRYQDAEPAAKPGVLEDIATRFTLVGED